MKNNKIIYSIIFLLLAITGCSDDLDKVTYHPGQSEPGVMSPVQESYVLDKNNPDQVIDTFKWGEIKFNYSAAVEYVLEIDLAGKDFENAQEVTATTELSSGIVASVLNASMNSLQKKYGFVHGTVQNVEFRIKGSISSEATPIYTNSVESKVTSYFEYPKVWIVGSYNDWGWEHPNTQVLFAFNDETPNEYTAWVSFEGKAQDGFKITDAKDWAHANFGTELEAKEVTEQEEVMLVNSGDSKNITLYGKNYYKFKFNKTTGLLTNMASMDSFGVAGTAMTEDVKMNLNPKNQEFTTLATLSDGEIYFRADAKDEVTYGLGNSDGVLVEGTNGILVEAGTYIITVDINNPVHLTYKIEKADPLDPAKMEAPQFNELGDITATEKQEVSFKWSAVSFGDQFATTVNYTLEMGVVGDNFTQPIVLTTTKDEKFTTTGTVLFNKIKKLNTDLELGDTYPVEFRLRAEVAGLQEDLLSDVIAAKITITEEPEYPNNLYMIGEAIGGWDWNTNGLDMIPVTETPGKFWIVRYLEADKAFKWSPVKDWNGDFAQLDNNKGFLVNDGNAIVEETGLYLIYIDMQASEITIEKAQLFGIGDAFNGWDNPLEMTVVNDKALINVVNNGELRLYAQCSSATNIDWWRMEFTLRNGEIVYRKNDGEINPVTSVEANQNIELDFNSNSGNIK